MIRPAHMLLGVLLGATDVHPAGQIVTYGGMEWVQPGNQTFFRSPDVVIQHIPAVSVPAHETDRINRKEIAHQLRNEAWRIEHKRSQTDDNNVADGLRRVIEQLDNKPTGPGTHDRRNDEVPH